VHARLEVLLWGEGDDADSIDALRPGVRNTASSRASSVSTLHTDPLPNNAPSAARQRCTHSPATS
jgi:hypothetical protein